MQPKGSPLKNGWWVCENTYAKPQKETTLARGDTFFMAEPSLFLIEAALSASSTVSHSLCQKEVGVACAWAGLGA